MPDGNRIVTGSDDGTARLWDLETGKEVRSLGEAGGKPVTALAVMAPAYIATGHDDGKVRVWDADKPSEPIVFESHEGAITALGAMSEPFRIIGFSKNWKGHIWNVLTRSDRSFGVRRTDIINTIAVTADGERFVTGSNAKVARVWDVETLEVRTELAGTMARSRPWRYRAMANVSLRARMTERSGYGMRTPRAARRSGDISTRSPM
jgi:WD40 repeat protein